MKLNNIKTVIFDMDGVITSEYMYWDAAALSVYELLFSRHYYGKKEIDVLWCMDNIALIRKIIFNDDKAVRVVKRLGVNTNWDLALVVFCISIALNPQLETLDKEHFEAVCSKIENMGIQAPEIYSKVGAMAAQKWSENEVFFAREKSKFWSQLQTVFGHWFLGSDRYFELYGEPSLPFGRSGLLELEKPIVPLSRLHELLGGLKQAGITLGIGTGRPFNEVEYPMKLWDIEKYFDQSYCANYSDTVKAETENNCAGMLAKPHPFVFLKAAAGGRYTDKQIIDREYDNSIIKDTLVVGDAPSDLIAAKEAGFLFAAVLTGISGDEMREYFEDNGADIIIDSVLDLAVI